MELTKITTLSGETAYVNKDKVIFLQQDEQALDFGEEPTVRTRIVLEDDFQFYTAEDIHSVAGRLNKSEIEEAVDRLLAHDSNGMVVRVRS